MADIDPKDIEIGTRVRERREAMRLTQQMLAAAIGVTFQQVQKYERGANRISASRLMRIAEALQTHPASFLRTSDTTEETISDDLMQTPGAVELLKAYCAIHSPRHREGLLAMAKALDAV